MSLLSHLRDIVLDEGHLTEDELKKLEEKHHDPTHVRTAEILMSEHLFSEESLYEMLAEHMGLEFLRLKSQEIPPPLLERFPQSMQSAHKFVPVRENNQEIVIATTDPTDMQMRDAIEKTTEKRVTYSVVTPAALAAVLRVEHKDLQESLQEISEAPTTDQIVSTDEASVVKLVNAILESAIVDGASDIHIEPSEKDLAIRFRVDGVLKRVMTLPMSNLSGIVARIKVLSRLKLDEHRLPQDGRFKIRSQQFEVSFRVSVLPVFDGEKIVLRLLDESRRYTSLDQLGLNETALNLLKRNLQKPHGMVLVTGPTGSGKTTTLYTALQVLNDVKVNISTIEDPIEYRLAGVNQSQVNTKIGFTFANGLRSLLRQDPNIILVGEIRDNDTAKIAINAALTGHLVLSTLHTNDAVTSLPRLLEMDVPSFLVASTTNIVVAQRLVRKICQECISSFTPAPALIKNVETTLGIESLEKRLVELGAREKKTDDGITLYIGKGCTECNHEGYRGRLGVYEILEITPEIRDLIASKASSGQILEKAKEQGMIAMLDDALIKATQGKTSLEEILRVTQE